MNFGSAKPHLVRVVVARFHDAPEYFLQLRLVINEAQERLTACALRANTKNVFRGRIELGDQEILVEKNDA